jgi:hypothetical protein
MELTKTKPSPSKPCLIHAFIKTDVRNAVNRTKRFISREHLEYVAKSEYQIPDSENCLKALKLVQQHSPDFLLNHCLRSYAFGVAMAHKVKSSFDKEVFFLGSIMHDLGLVEPFDGEDTFELEGAGTAHQFCLEQEIEQSKADMIHEMIALHTSVGIAHKHEPEIALLHYGAGADVLGLWLHDIHKKTLQEILTEYPRLDFKEGMSKLVSAQIERKPHSYMKTMVDLGFIKNMQKAPFIS